MSHHISDGMTGCGGTSGAGSAGLPVLSASAHTAIFGEQNIGDQNISSYLEAVLNVRVRVFNQALFWTKK